MARLAFLNCKVLTLNILYAFHVLLVVATIFSIVSASAINRGIDLGLNSSELETRSCQCPNGAPTCPLRNPEDCLSYVDCIEGGEIPIPCPTDEGYSVGQKKCVPLDPSSCPMDKSFTCPVNDIKKTQCHGPKACLYADPVNCHFYIQCTVNADGMTGTPTRQPCPDGLEWNDNEKSCDYPENSTCGYFSSVYGATRGLAHAPKNGSGLEYLLGKKAPFTPQLF